MAVRALTSGEARSNPLFRLLLRAPLRRSYVAVLALAMAFGGSTRVSLVGASYQLSVAEIVLGAGGLLALVTALIKGCVPLLPAGGKLVPWICVVLWSLAAVLWASDPLQSLAGALALFQGLAAYLIVIILPDHKEPSLTTPVRLLVVSLVLQLAANMAPFLLSGDPPLSFYARKEYAVTAMGASNYVAVYLGFGLIYELAARRPLWPLFAVTAGVGLILTLSRAGLLATGIVAALLLIIAVWKGGARSVILWLVLLGFVALLLLATPFGKLLIAQLRHLSRSASVLTRVQLWRKVWHDFTQTPVLGLGLGWRRDPHNLFLQALHDLGIIGTLFLVTLLLAPLAHVRRSSSWQPLAILLGYLAMLLHFSVEAGFFGSLSQIWLGTVLAHLTLAATAGGDGLRPPSMVPNDGWERA